ncbi:MAG: hypothetical protein Tsb009_06620 [Planctomycetaceae bacterium]
MTGDRRSSHRRQSIERRVADRRDDERLPAETTIRFLRSSGNHREVLHGMLLDVSRYGLKIHFDEPLDIDETLLIEVRDEDNRCFNSTVRVRRVMQNVENGQDVGCEFCVALSTRQMETLKRLTLEHAVF